MALFPRLWKLRLRLWLQSALPGVGPLLMRGLDRLRTYYNRVAYRNFEIKEVRNFLTDAECRYLIARAAPVLFPSRIMGEVSAVTSAARTSTTAFVHSHEDPVVQEIRGRFAALTGKSLHCQERMQVTCYLPGQFYVPHFDSGELLIDREVPGTHREYTIIVYLNEGFEGGGTLFPLLGRRIAPEKGKAVIFCNLTSDGNDYHPMSLHAGERVRSGEKWICNQWIRQRPLR